MTQFSSRPPFNDDPWPLVWDGHSPRDQMRADTDFYRAGNTALAAWGGYSRKPRPEFNRPQTNPTSLVLADLRDYWKHHGTKLTARHAADYLDICDIDAMGVPAGHVDHAREVLARLAKFAPARVQG